MAIFPSLIPFIPTYYKFPSGNFGIIKNGELKIRKYWNINEEINIAIITNETEALEQLKQLLVSSVKYRLISDVPFGTFLSGGIDSSLVTAIAQSLNSKPVDTFNISFGDAKYNESQYAKAIADYLGTNHHEYKVTENDAIALIPGLLDIYDEPYADSSAIPTLLVSKMARQNVTMTLSGDGGDELFMGYGAYKWANRLSNPFIKAMQKPARAVFSAMNDKYRRASHLFESVSDDDLASHIFSQNNVFFQELKLPKF